MSQTTMLLLFVSAVVAIVCRRLRIPYSVGLVLAGMALVLAPHAPSIHISSETLYNTLLPPLLFEAAFSLHWPSLRRQLPLVLVLAVFGILIGMLVTASGMHWLGGWPWAVALVFGALISATDPVSVIATFREARVCGRLPLLVESESLFNDGVAAVAFAVAVQAAMGQSTGPAQIALRLLTSVAGALVVGALSAAAALFLIGRSRDHLVHLVVTTIAAWGSFIAAERVHASGVLAVILTGLIVGNMGPLRSETNPDRPAIISFWEFAAFTANSLIFLLIGIFEARLYRGSVMRSEWWLFLVAVLVVLVGRAASVYPLCLLFRRSTLSVPATQQHALVWGGLRGALALALALGLPDTMPFHDAIVDTSSIVVAVSIFLQGLTMPLLLRHIGELPTDNLRS